MRRNGVGFCLLQTWNLFKVRISSYPFQFQTGMKNKISNLYPVGFGYPRSTLIPHEIRLKFNIFLYKKKVKSPKVICFNNTIYLTKEKIEKIICSILNLKTIKLKYKCNLRVRFNIFNLSDGKYDFVIHRVG
jgi:hypothetical protein